ncbi:MAG: hypothetical protein ABL903_16330 [Methylococcales bacterium]
MLIDFSNASKLFIQLDTDIAEQANPDCVNQNHSARHCCQEKISQKLEATVEPNRCHYVLPTQNTETWILASHEPPLLIENAVIENYEIITDTEQRLINLGYKSKKGVNNNSARKLNKKPASQYRSHGKQLVENLTNARQRCAELDRLCVLLENIGV